MKTEKGLIVALDVAADKAKALVERMGEAVDFYKVSPFLMMQDAAFVPWLIARGKRVFLDCKWYDIPSQVARSVEAAGRMGVTSCTIHASAGSEVMKAALSVTPRPLIWGVTVLTSMGAGDLIEIGVADVPFLQVHRLATLAQACGLNGLVCSPLEISYLREKGIVLDLITPGIQFGEAGGKDQKRTASPQDAWSAGAAYIVVGRSILDSKDPAETARKILECHGPK
ncbi:MAG: orotidine-5'-phosphate decarboxylase [Elusimicrobia bacterium]|nr:orotidine-5'-phosphate decarboxylase [Elusimicrobiota bacterium]